MRQPTRVALAGLAVAATLAVAQPVRAVDDVFIYSSASTIRGLNLTLGTDTLLTDSPIASSANALAVNANAGFVYYGDGTSVYRWDPALGSGPLAHSRMMDFSTGPVTAPITELDSTGGTFLDDTYYVGSETNGYVTEVYALTMSLDGTQVVAAEALGLLDACGCTAADIGGFGDLAAASEGGVAVIHGTTSAIGNAGGSLAGRWRLVPSTGTFEFLAPAANGQLANSLSGRLYSNVGQAVREVNRTTGATSATTLFTTSAPVYDFTSGFSLDFGDAPDSYGAAFHRIDGAPGAPRIGPSGPDNDPGTLNAGAGGGASNGAGDDDAGSDDEDAVQIAAPVSVTAGSHAIAIDCPAGTRVAGWIDLNLNGRFDAGERNDNHPASCVGGGTTLEWYSLPGASGGSSWLRLRASGNVSAISSPVGIASDGEVEDHAVRIDGPDLRSCAVYDASDVPRAISATSTPTVVSTVTVPPGDIVSDVNVLDVNGTHTWVSDLEFRLFHDGVERALNVRACGDRDDFAFSFDDERTGTPPCPPTDGGTYRPRQSLDAFDGTDSGGTWELRVQDFFNQDGGALRGWSLELCTVAPATQDPALRLGKAASVSGRDAVVTLALENVGDVTLTALDLIDDLDAAFGAGNFTVTTPPTLVSGPATVVPDPAFTGGGADTSLLAAGSRLAPGERATVRFTVRIDTLSDGAGGAPGDYRNSSNVAGDAPDGTTVTDVSNAGLDLSVDGDAPTPIVVSAAARLSGRVFEDVSTPGASHDGIDQPGEPGAGGRTVELLLADGTSLGAVTTDGDGSWSFVVPAAATGAAVTVHVADAGGFALVSEAPGFADVDVTDGRITLVPGVGEDIANIDLGVAPAPGLEADRVGVASPGTRTSFAHVHVAGAHGRLAASLGPGSGGAATAMEARLVLDADCDGAAGAGEAVFAGSLDVGPGTATCFVVDAFVPGDALPGARLEVAIDTLLTLVDPAGTGHATVFERRNVDVVGVTAANGGRLELGKRVRNVTSGGAFGTGNEGLPGHVLEYEITYRNAGPVAIDGLEVNDLAPVRTRVQAGSPACVDTPAPLACTVTETGETLGWRFTGALPAGGAGSVTYRVTID